MGNGNGARPVRAYAPSGAPYYARADRAAGQGAGQSRNLGAGAYPNTRSMSRNQAQLSLDPGAGQSLAASIVSLLAQVLGGGSQGRQGGGPAPEEVRTPSQPSWSEPPRPPDEQPTLTPTEPQMITLPPEDYSVYGPPTPPEISLPPEETPSLLAAPPDFQMLPPAPAPRAIAQIGDRPFQDAQRPDLATRTPRARGYPAQVPPTEPMPPMPRPWRYGPYRGEYRAPTPESPYRTYEERNRAAAREWGPMRFKRLIDGIRRAGTLGSEWRGERRSGRPRVMYEIDIATARRLLNDDDYEGLQFLEEEYFGAPAPDDVKGK